MCVLCRFFESCRHTYFLRLSRVTHLFHFLQNIFFNVKFKLCSVGVRNWPFLKVSKSWKCQVKWSWEATTAPHGYSRNSWVLALENLIGEKKDNLPCQMYMVLDNHLVHRQHNGKGGIFIIFFSWGRAIHVHDLQLIVIILGLIGFIVFFCVIVRLSTEYHLLLFWVLLLL